MNEVTLALIALVAFVPLVFGIAWLTAAWMGRPGSRPRASRRNRRDN